MIFWLLLSQLAFAGPKTYSVRDDSGGSFQLEVVEAPACVDTIHSLLYPESDIQKGLAALLAFSQPSTVSCLDDTLENWAEKMSPPKYVAPAGANSLPEDWEDLYSEAYRKLDKLRDCILDDYEGTYYYEEKKKLVLKFCGHATTKEELAAAEAEYLKQKEFSQKWQELTGRIKDVLVPDPSLGSAKAEALGSKVNNCSPQYGKDWDEKKAKWICEHETLSASQYEAISQEYQKEQDKISKASEEWDHKRALAEANLTKLLLRTPGLKEQLAAVFPAELCVNPHAPKSGTYSSVAEERAEECKGKWQSAEPLRKKLTELLGTVPQMEAKNKEQEPAYLEKRRAEEAKLNPRRNFNYATRSLLMRYQSFLAKGGKPEQLGAFCAENQKQQERDYEFSKFNSDAHFISYDQDARYPGIIKTHGLSEGELSAIFSFTNDFYKKINPALLKGKLDNELQAYRGLLDAALAKLPAYAEGPVRRFVDLPQNILAQHKVGNVVCYKSFSSTSKDVDWTWDGKQELLIYPGAKGKDVSRISTHANEQEVLFTANSCFKVLGKKAGAGGYDRTRFILAEVDKGGKVIAKLPKKVEMEQP